MAARKQVRMNRQKILDEVRKSGSYLGSSGVNRRALFVKPRAGEPLRCFVLPDLRPRGKSGELFPYLAINSHWVDIPRDDGEGVIRRGMTCLRHLREEEPNAFEYLQSENLLSDRDHDCVACMILEQIDHDELPKGRFGVDFAGRTAYHFQVILDDPGAYAPDDNQKIKVLVAGATGRKSFIEQLCDPDLVEDGFFEDHGIFTVWRAEGRAWSVSLDLRKKCWMKEWREKLYTMELVVPFIRHFEDQVPIFTSMLPAHADTIEQIVQGFDVPKVEKPKPPGKRADKKAAQGRVKAAG